MMIRNILARIDHFLGGGSNDFSSLPVAPASRKPVVSVVTPKTIVESPKVVQIRRRSTDPDEISETTERRVEKMSDLPSYTAILTSLREEDGGLQIPDQLRKTVAVLKLGSTSVAIVLHGDNARGGDEFRSVRSLLRQKGFALAGTFVATTSVFESLSAAPDNKAIEVRDAAKSVKLFDIIVEGGIKEKASDIHICIREQSAKVLVRVYGRLFPLMNLTREETIEAVAVAYNKLAVESSRSKEDPQFLLSRSLYCMIDRAVSGARWRFRYQSFKVEGGNDVVLRILHGEAVSDPKTIEQLGYELSQRESLRLAMMKAIGAIFVAGVTGSGKSTTLMTLMTMGENRRQQKYYSIEDPVEYRMYGVSQIPIQRDISAKEDSAGMAEAMRVILRGDPNVIMAGEIRDKETADMFSSAVQSGHRCLTTIHAASGIDIVGRMSSQPIMMPRSVLTSKRFISALVYQALVPTLCKHCSLPASEVLDADYLLFIEAKFAVSTKNMRAKLDAGCAHADCKAGTGGVTVAAEIILPTAEILMMLQEGKDTTAEMLWRATRRTGFDDPDMTGKTAFEHALYKSVLGIVDPRDIEAAFESFQTYEVLGVADEH